MSILIHIDPKKNVAKQQNPVFWATNRGLAGLNQDATTFMKKDHCILLISDSIKVCFSGIILNKDAIKLHTVCCEAQQQISEWTLWINLYHRTSWFWMAMLMTWDHQAFQHAFDILSVGHLLHCSQSRPPILDSQSKGKLTAKAARFWNPLPVSTMQMLLDLLESRWILGLAA